MTLKESGKEELKTTIPPLQHPVTGTIQEAAQVLLSSARTGYAITDDIAARWTHCRQHKSPEIPPDQLLCHQCHREPPIISHVLWSCPELADIHDNENLRESEAWRNGHTQRTKLRTRCSQCGPSPRRRTKVPKCENVDHLPFLSSHFHLYAIAPSLRNTFIHSFICCARAHRSFNSTNKVLH